MSEIRAHFRLLRPDFQLDTILNLPGRGISALFGPSGSGKTSLLRCMAGLEPQCRGFFSVAGEIWQDEKTSLPAWRRPLGYVFQEGGLFPHLTAGGNLRYALRRARNAMDEQALEEVIGLLGIGGLLQRKPARLSGGERQRVAIARALAVQPRLLLMDEPLSSLDRQRKREILPYLQRLHDNLEIPVIYVTHALDELTRLADHLVLLEEGKVLASGALHDLLLRHDLPLARDQDAESLIHASLAGHDEAHHLSYLDFAGGCLVVGMLPGTAGKPVRVRVHARDVSIALAEHRDTSILNILPARVLKVTVLNDWQNLVSLGLGEKNETVLLARITRRSAGALDLQPGKPVFAQVKSVVLAD